METLFALIASLGGFILIPIGIYLIGWIRVINEYERAVVYRLGRIIPSPKGPGLILLLAPGIIDTMKKIDMRTIALDVPSQDVITRDNVSIKVNAVVYYRVVDPSAAVNDIEDYHYATSQMAQTTLRSIVGQADLDGVLAEREKISHEIQTILDHATNPWGIKVSNVEIKNVDLPADMQRAMARQAEAERERRAKIIGAEGESQAAANLVEAADMMRDHPMAMQMRYLQTMVEVGAEKNSTIFFPIPIEIMDIFRSKPSP